MPLYKKSISASAVLRVVCQLLALLATMMSLSLAGDARRGGARLVVGWGRRGHDASRIKTSSGITDSRKRGWAWILSLRGGQSTSSSVTGSGGSANKEGLSGLLADEEESSLSSAVARNNIPASVNESTVDDGARTTTFDAENSTSLLLPRWKAALPPILQRKGNKTLQRLVLGQVEIYLLGTAHVSKDSCHDVQALLEAVQPACIFVELCDARMPLLEGNETILEGEAQEKDKDAATTSKKPSWRQRLSQIQESQDGNRWQALSTLLLTSVQEDYAETLGVELGGEFRVAYSYWRAHHQQQQQSSPTPTSPTITSSSPSRQRSQFPVLILGDRPLSLTLVRAWESLSWWGKTRVIVGLLWSSLRKPNPDEIRAWLESVLQEEGSDILTESLAELRQHFPTLYRTIISERDTWMACKLVQTCRVLQGIAAAVPSVNDADGPTIVHPPRRIPLVAIVGAGHLPGIVQWLTQPPPTTNTTSRTTTEAMLLDLCQTNKWHADPVVQQEVIPQWVHDVTQVQDVDLGEQHPQAF